MQSWFTQRHANRLKLRFNGKVLQLFNNVEKKCDRLCFTCLLIHARQVWKERRPTDRPTSNKHIWSVWCTKNCIFDNSRHCCRVCAFERPRCDKLLSYPNLLGEIIEKLGRSRKLSKLWVGRALPRASAVRKPYHMLFLLAFVSCSLNLFQLN